MNPILHPFDTPPERGDTIEVAEGILWIRLPLPMALDHVNVYALDDGDSWTILDAGMHSRLGRDIWESLLSGPLAGKPVARVIVTHHHPDHVGAAGWLQSHFGAEMWTTRTAWLFARMLTLDTQEVWPEETLAFYRSAGMDKGYYEKRVQQRPFNFSDMVAPMPLGFRRIKQSDVIRAGGRDWRVHIGNGHAPEHATFWSMDDNLVLSGDQILPRISPNLGVYATEPEADPLSDWLEACDRLSKLAEERHFVLPGHKLPFTGLPARMRQLAENHHHALERLQEHIDRPLTAAECFAPLFKREIGDGEYVLALVEAIAHLNHLYQAGKARRWRDGEKWLFQAN